MKLLVTGIYFLAIVCLSDSMAQLRPNFKHLTRDQGLSSNKINCIVKVKLGYMWFGTEDGISRYDGVNFKIYKKQSGIINNYVLSISSDPANGNLWIGT